MRLIGSEELRERRWEQPPVPAATEHNPREWYMSEEYLEWYNTMESRAQRLHRPATVEKRAAAMKLKGAHPDKFGLLPKNESGTTMQTEIQLSLRNTRSLTKAQRRIIGKQLETQEAVLAHMRSLVSSDDVERMYDTLTEQAIATGDAKLIEVWMKFMVGLPAQQINVTRFNLSQRLRDIADGYDERRPGDVEAEYRVVDAENS